MTTARLWVPPGVALSDYSDRFSLFCQAMNYEIAGIDTDGKPWWDSLVSAHDMDIEVILAAERAHLPKDYAPRVEIADLSLLPEGWRRRNPGP